MTCNKFQSFIINCRFWFSMPNFAEGKCLNIIWGSLPDTVSGINCHEGVSLIFLNLVAQETAEVTLLCSKDS